MAGDLWIKRIDEELAPPVVPQDKGKPADIVFEVAEPLAPHRVSHPEPDSASSEDAE